MSSYLDYFAGERALSIIKNEGLKQERVKVVAGAAGGPKWLVLSGLDRVISALFKERQKPLFLVGSSIGAWRFAAYAAGGKSESIDIFEANYISQIYDKKPSPAEISYESHKILNSFVGGHEDEIINHPFMRLNIFSVKCRWPLSSEKKILQLPGLAVSSFFNYFNRDLINLFFQRTLFYDRRDSTSFHNVNRFPAQKVPLTEDNLKSALISSGSIPILMQGVRDIPGAQKGTYRDGGIIDYHLDIPFPADDNLVLYPHYMNRIIPGWFDKNLRRRKPDSDNFRNVLLICPSKKFIKRLPCNKIPDRDDFLLYNSNRERISKWKEVTALGRILGSEFMNDMESGAIKHKVKPLIL